MDKDKYIGLLQSQRRQLKRELKWSLYEMRCLGVTNAQEERYEQAEKVLKKSKG
jgi:hypothetical protein